MTYITISLVTSAIVILLVYQFSGRIFDVHIKLKQLVLCSGCAIFISLLIPRFFLSYNTILWTIAATVLIAAIFSYYIAYYDDQKHVEKDRR